MKYMTFNSSCSYAGLANMLAQYGIDTEDRLIALAIQLPYLFTCNDGVYLSGPMLQAAEWFDLYLNPIGYRMAEETVPADHLAGYLDRQKTAMFGIRLDEKGKHAVVCIGKDADSYVCINNKWENEASPNVIRLTKNELISSVEANVVVATLQQIPPRSVCFAPLLRASIPVLRKNLADIIHLCDAQETVLNLRSKLNTLFRPLFLDGITMLNLIDQPMLANDFAGLQQELLHALRQDPEQKVCLKEYLSMDKLHTAVEMYVQLIIHALDVAQGG